MAVLVSGEGTNLQAIIDAIDSGAIRGVTVDCVASSRPEAHAVQRAKNYGIATVILKKKELTDQLLEIFRKVDLVVLAGFLWILPPEVLGVRPIINVHPSLLPLFGGKGMYGERVTEEVLKSGMKVTGVTVHLVTEDVDAGPIILQECVRINEDDTPSTLLERMHPIEHELIVKAIKLFSEKKYKIEGKRVIFL